MSFTPVVMPQMGLEVTEGTVISIHVEVGARVSEGDVLVELETDKAVSEVAAPRAGLVHALEVAIGDTVPVGASLLVLADDAPVEVSVGAGTDASVAQRSENGAAPETDRVRAAPVARRAAEKLGVPLPSITGTGPRGRITLHDVESAAAAPPAAPALTERVEPMSATARAVARRMTASQLIPQFALSRDIDAGWLLAEKDRLKAEGVAGVSVNDLLMQALADTLARHPSLAASYVESDDGRPHLRRRAGADIGLAVATERGLVVPVIRRADALPLRELAAERARLVELARRGGLALEDMSGATVTISNLASAGVDRFNAMVNPGEAAILAVGRVVERVVPQARGIAIASMLTLTLTLDHRVVDGAGGGAALAELASLLEGEMRWRP